MLKLNILSGIVKVVKRALTKDGGKFLTTKVEGDSNGFAVAVIIVRVIVPLLGGALAIWLSRKLGVSVDELIETSKGLLGIAI